MKTYKEFMEAVGDPLTLKNTIPLGPEAQRNLNQALSPGSKPVKFTLQTVNPSAPPPPQRSQQTNSTTKSNQKLSPLDIFLRLLPRTPLRF